MKPLTGKDFDGLEFFGFPCASTVAAFTAIDKIDESSVTLFLNETNGTIIPSSDGIVNSGQDKRLPPSSF